MVENDNDNDDIFQKPKGNTIVCPDCLQFLLVNSGVCKECSSSLRVVEKIGTKQGLAAKWRFNAIQSFNVRINAIQSSN